MIDPYRELVDRIRGEIPDLEGVVQRALRAWPKAQNPSPEQEFYLDSVALNLQAFYAGAERLFELIARRMDRNLPSGEAWHRDLLKQMAQDLPGIRPAAISQEIATVLDKFRRFRHLVQNIYVTNLKADKMAELTTALPALWAKLRDELLAFADFIEDI
jgi:hypothetical protein